MKCNFSKHRYALFILTTTIFVFTACSRQTEPISKTGFYFDTVIDVTLYDSEDTALLEECFAIADTYENMLSKTREGSDIWNINHAAGTSVTVSDDTITLLNTAIYYAGLSDGLADPTIGSVSELWDFSASSGKVLPSEDKLTEALAHVNYQGITITGNAVTLNDPHAKIDLGFIAKGFIADRMKDYLESQGVQSALINLGGNVLAIGCRPDGSPFRVGIQKPFAPAGTPAVTLPVTDLSVVTSGIYERYFEKNGKIYHHILNAKTGYPIWNNLSEVTILSESSMNGDALSTTCFILGLEKGMELIESLEGTEALFITDDGELHPTSGLTLP